MRETWQVLYFQQKIFLNKSLTWSPGYSKAEVDEFLDDVIKDYETYVALVKSLRQESRGFEEELSNKPQSVQPVSNVWTSLKLGSTDFYD